MNTFYKIFIVIGLLGALCFSGSALGNKKQDIIPVLAPSKSIAILPILSGGQYTSFSMYNNLVYLLSNDMANHLNRHQGIRTQNYLDTLNTLKAKGLLKKYHMFLSDYQGTLSINSDITSELAKSLSSDLILLVSSTIDTQSKALEENTSNKYMPWKDMSISPKSDILINIVLIDPQTGQYLWKSNQRKTFKTSKLNKSLQDFTNSQELSSDLLDFSSIVSQNTATSIYNYLVTTGSAQVSVEMIKKN